MIWSGVLLVAVKAVVHQILALVSLLFLSVSVVVSGANHASGGGVLSTGITP